MSDEASHIITHHSLLITAAYKIATPLEPPSAKHYNKIRIVASFSPTCIPLPNVEIQIAASIDEVEQETWDRLSAGRAFASHAWYRFGEAVLPDSQPCYLLLWQGKEPVARATFWEARREPLPVLSRPLRAAFQALLACRPLFICRSPLAETGGLALPQDERRDEALRLILQAAREQARARRASFLAFDYLEPDLTGWSGWGRSCAALTVPDPGTYLEIPHSGFEEYISALSSSAKKDYRRHANHAEARHISMRVTEKVTGAAEALPLIHTVEARHAAAAKPWAAAMLAKAGMVPSAWIEARVEEKLAGCGLVLEDQGVQMTTLLGLDYSVPYAYFQLVYAALRHAFESGARTLRGGSGAYELKERLGFARESCNHTVFSGNGRLFQRIGLMAAG